MLILNFFQVETDFYCEKHLHTDLITWPRLNQAKSESNSLPDHLFFYRLWHIKSFIRPSLDIIYGFCLDAKHVKADAQVLFNYILSNLYKSGTISMICHKCGKSFIEIILLLATYGMARTPNNF